MPQEFDLLAARVPLTANLSRRVWVAVRGARMARLTLATATLCSCASMAQPARSVGPPAKDPGRAAILPQATPVSAVAWPASAPCHAAGPGRDIVCQLDSLDGAYYGAICQQGSEKGPGAGSDDGLEPEGWTPPGPAPAATPDPASTAVRPGVGLATEE